MLPLKELGPPKVMPKREKPIIGIVGGIGAGKTAVAHAFASCGCLVVDSDRLNRVVLEREAVRLQIQNWWGAEVAPPSGVRRDRLAAIVFRDPAERRRLESLTHPLISEMREAMIADGIKDAAVKAIILDSPLLFESNLDRLCDAVVFVEASAATRRQRVATGRGWDQAEHERRESMQAPLAEKRARATFEIRNEGSPHELANAASTILERVLAERR